MNARCFNGPRTLVSNKLRHFHGGRNESVFSSHAFLPALPPRCPSARKENEYPAPFPPIWTLSQAGDTLFSNQPFRLPEKVCNCIHSVHPSCQIISFLSSDGRLNMLNPIKRPFSAPYVSASQSLFAATAPRIIARMAQRRPGTIATHPRHGRKASNARINPTIPRTNARMVETVSGTERRGSE